MGNKYCYQKGQKFDNLISRIIKKDFDEKTTISSPEIKEFIDYLENDFSKLPGVPSYVNNKVKQRNGDIDPYSMKLYLNSFQLFVFILKSAVKFNNSRLEVIHSNSENMNIKMEVKKFDLLEKMHLNILKIPKKKAKIDSQFLLHFIPFQERVFKMIQEILPDEYSSYKWSDYSRNQQILMEMVIEYFSQTFHIWSIFGLKNFSNGVQDIFELVVKKAKIFIPIHTNLLAMKSVFELIPMRMFKQTKHIILDYLQTLYHEKKDSSDQIFVEIIKTLLRNLINKKKHQLVLDMMEYYSKQEPKMVTFFINACVNQQELEVVVLDFLVTKIHEDDSYLRVFTSLLKKCSVELINATNFNKMTDYLLEMLPKTTIDKTDKVDFFQTLLLKCQKNVHIGRYNFFKNIFIKLKSKHEVSQTLHETIMGSWTGSAENLKSHDIIDKIFVRLMFEVIAFDKNYVDILVIILENDVERNSTAGFKELNSEILAKIEKELNALTKNSGQNALSFLYFTKFMKVIILIQRFIGEENYYIREYLNFYVKLLQKVDSIAVFLFYIVCLYQFQKLFGGNDNVYEIIQKYDGLLEKPGYKNAFKLMDSSQSQEEVIVEQVLRQIQVENRNSQALNFQKDIEDIIRFLKEDYKLDGFNGPIYFAPRSTERSFLEMSGMLDSSISHYAEDQNYLKLDSTSMMAEAADFEEMKNYSLQKNRNVMAFKKRFEKEY